MNIVSAEVLQALATAAEPGRARTRPTEQLMRGRPLSGAGFRGLPTSAFTSCDEVRYKTTYAVQLGSAQEVPQSKATFVHRARNSPPSRRFRCGL
mmetsp:Transcript_37748/g.93824  ORF Transcript_37748/g.93824 Transcript_37748/m.93824 type:complete len:95 (-) Transcript_37748:174-458(-)